MDMSEIIKVEGVSFGYSDRIQALRDIHLTIGEGERFAIIGSNGTGKSSLLKIINGLLKPASGRVFFRGREMTEANLNDGAFLKYCRSSMGFLFQDSDVQLFCPTVMDELLFGPLQLEMDESTRRQRVSEIMAMLAIEHLQDRPSYMLSGGEKKRVAIASVLTMNPDVLLLDEPTGGLDPRTRSFLTGLLIALNEAGKTIVIATHDLSLVSELQCRVAVLSEDHRVESVGSTDDILHDLDLLLKVNLIHEHIHYHGREVHSHLHPHHLIHRHDEPEKQA
jgi:cobalt/nickel transport system ATP-binding protein